MEEFKNVGADRNKGAPSGQMGPQALVPFACSPAAILLPDCGTALGERGKNRTFYESCSPPRRSPPPEANPVKEAEGTFIYDVLDERSRRFPKIIGKSSFGMEIGSNIQNKVVLHMRETTERGEERREH